MEKILIIPRVPEHEIFDYKGHGYYEYFYDNLSEDYKIVILSSSVHRIQSRGNITVYPWKFNNKFSAALKLFKAIITVKPDLVIGEDTSLKSGMGFLFSRLMRTPTLMRMGSKPSNRFKTFISSLLSTKKIAVSETVGELMFGEFQVIYPGVRFFDEEIVEEESGNQKVGYLGRFSQEKGFDRFLNLVESNLNSKRYSFFIAGYGDFEKERLLNLKSASNVKFLGKIPNKEVFNYLKKLDFLYMPSRREGMPRAALESLKCQTPVIGWNIPSLNELIENKELIVESNEEVEQILNTKSNDFSLNWFEQSEYTIEKEMMKTKQIINKLIK